MYWLTVLNFTLRPAKQNCNRSLNVPMQFEIGSQRDMVMNQAVDLAEPDLQCL